MIFVEDRGNLGKIETFQCAFKNTPLLEEKQFSIFFFSFLMLKKNVNLQVTTNYLIIYWYIILLYNYIIGRVNKSKK